MPAKKEKDSFAAQYQELEKLVSWFESGEVDLEEGVKKLAAGSELVKKMKQHLKTVENKIKELTSKD